MSGLVASCAPKVKIIVMSPAEIDTKKIARVAVGSFEIATISQMVYVDKKGYWEKEEVRLGAEEKKSISRQVRAQVINSLAQVPYFKLVYTDEFEKLENDRAFQDLVGTVGYKTGEIDAVINGKIWIDFRKTRGADVAKGELTYAQGGKSKRAPDVTIQKVIWWPFQSMRGNLVLETKLTRLAPTEVVAVVVEERRFADRIGGAPLEGMELLESAASEATAFFKPRTDSSSFENSPMVLPSFDQMVTDLASSIASSFTRKIAVSEKKVSYPIDTGGDTQSVQLIKAGAYEMAIDRLQRVAAKSKAPEDLYNLGLSFEATGDFGLAKVYYREAYETDPGNFIIAQGLGRIEKALRENPKLKRQLAEKQP